LASEASNLKQQRASGKPLGMRYVGWLWDLLPRRKQSLTMREHQRELDLEPTNPAAMINDFREYQKFEGKLPIKQTAVGRTVMNMSGDTLTGQSVQLRDLLDGKQCTLLLFKFRQLGEEHLSLYRRHFMQSIVKSDDWTARGTDAGVVDVVVTENPMFRPLSWLINWGNRRQTPAEFHVLLLLLLFLLFNRVK
jgi:hypothetical protein